MLNLNLNASKVLYWGTLFDTGENMEMEAANLSPHPPGEIFVVRFALCHSNKEQVFFSNLLLRFFCK